MAIVYLGEGRMGAEFLFAVSQSNCRHEKHRKYSNRSFDMLNGFEIVATKCFNCHKTLELTIRKVNAPSRF
jgi:hypothetical protein